MASLRDSSRTLYPGLRPFEESDSDVFFGQETQQEALLGRLSTSQFVWIIGASGCGKSSLVRAGLLPFLRHQRDRSGEPRWSIAVTHPGESPMRLLATALRHLDPKRKAEDIEASLRRHTSSIQEFLAGSPDAGRRLLIFVDQFEELFRFRRRNPGERAMDESALYVKLLLDSVREPDSPVYVVTTMRSEYVEDCSDFYDLSDAINEGVFLLPRMTRLQCEEAIASPADTAGIEVEPALIQRLLNESEERADGLPLLQHALREIQDRWASRGRADRPFGLEHFKIEESDETVPKINRLLDQRLNDIYRDDVKPQDSSLVQTCFKLLSEYDAKGRETRRSCPVSELIEVAQVPIDHVDRVVAAFRNERRGATFLRVLNAEGETAGDGPLRPSDILDLSHECLMRQWTCLKAWMKEEREKASILRDLDRDAAAGGRLSNFATRRYVKWREESKPTSTWANRYRGRFDPVAGATYLSFAPAMEFLQRQELRQWFQRLAWIGGSILALIVTAGLAVAFGRLWRNAENASREALAQQLAAQAQTLRAENATQLNEPALLAAESMLLAPGFDADRVIRDCLRILARPTARLYHKIDQTGSVRTIALSPDGSSAASGGDDNAAHLFDVKTGKVLLTFPHEGPVRAVVFSPNGKYLATASDDKTTRIFRIANGMQTALYAHKKGVRAVAWSPDSRRIGSGGDDGEVQVFEPDSNDPPRAFQDRSADKQDHGITAVLFTADGVQLITASEDGLARVFDLATGQCVRRVRHGSAVRAIALSRDGYLATGSEDHYTRVIDLRTGLEKVKVDNNDGVYSVALSPDGRYVISGGQSGTAQVTAIEKRTTAVIPGQRPVRAVAVSPEGDYAAIAGDDGTVRVVSFPDAQLISQLEVRKPVLALSFGPGHRVAASGKSDTAWLFDADPAPRFRQFHESLPNRSATFAPNGSMLAAVDANSVVRLYDLQSGKSKHEIKESAAVYAIALDHDGRQIALGGDKNVRVIDTGTGAARYDIAQPEAVYGIAFAPGDKHLAVGRRNGEVEMYDAESRKSLWKVAFGSEEQIFTMSFSPDSRLLAAAGFTGIAHLLDASTGKERDKFGNRGQDVKALALSPDGTYLAVGQRDSVLLYRLAKSAAPVARSPGQANLEISDLQFSPDSQSLAVAASLERKGYLRVFEIPWLEERSRLNTADPLLAFRFSSDGRRMLSAHGVSSIEVDEDRLRPGDLLNEVCSRLGWNFLAEEWDNRVRRGTRKFACMDTAREKSGK